MVSQVASHIIPVLFAPGSSLFPPHHLHQCLVSEYNHNTLWMRFCICKTCSCDRNVTMMEWAQVQAGWTGIHVHVNWNIVNSPEDTLYRWLLSAQINTSLQVGKVQVVHSQPGEASWFFAGTPPHHRLWERLLTEHILQWDILQVLWSPHCQTKPTQEHGQCQ